MLRAVDKSIRYHCGSCFIVNQTAVRMSVKLSITIRTDKDKDKDKTDQYWTLGSMDYNNVYIKVGAFCC